MVIEGESPGRRVLMGFAEALSAPEVAWSLAGAGYKVLAFGRKGRASALRQSRYAQVLEVTAPEIDADATVRELRAIGIEQLKAGAVAIPFMPLDDGGVWLCNRLTNDSNWILAGPSGEAALLALDKRHQSARARAAGFKVPDTWVVNTPSDALKCPCPFPLVLRPAEAVSHKDGRLHKGRNWICADRRELERAVEAWRGAEALLVQPFLCGIGEGLFGLATKDGVVAWSAHRRLRMMNPHGSGSSACASKRVSESLKEPVTRFVQESGWRGQFMIELLRDGSGESWFIEFNGRAWGSMALSRRQGLEYPAWTVQLAIDPHWRFVGIPEAKSEIVCRNIGREIMHLVFVLRGKKSAAITEWPSFWRSLTDMLRLGKKDSIYNLRRDDLKVFVSDGWCTIRDQIFKPKRQRKNA